MTTITEKVYQGRDNISLVLFKDSATGIAIDFSTATRYVLTLGVSIVDTDISSTAIVTTAVDGELQFDLGDLSLPLGMQYATLTVYDPAHSNGQVIVCAPEQVLSFDVVSCT